MKKKLALLLASILATTSLVACGSSSNTQSASKIDPKSVNVTGYPIVSEPITLTAVGYGDPGSPDWGTFPVFQELAEQTNVNVEWTTISGDGATEKLNLILSSKELPDMIFSGLNSTAISKHAKNGILIPLEDLIDKYAPNIKRILDENPEIRKAITMPDGHIYSIPGINSDQEPIQTTTLNINKTWLDKLGLKVPETTEEFKTVLEAFKTKDPNGNGQADEIPFTFMPTPPYTTWNGDDGFMGAFGVTMGVSSLMFDENNKLVFTPAQEGYKEYISYMADLYKNGFLDKELFTQDFNQYMAKVTSVAGTYLTSGPVASSDEYVAINPLKGPDGDQLWAGVDFSIDKNRGVITAACENPEVAIRYIDSFFEPITSLKLQNGKNLKEVGDGKYEILPSKPGEQSLAPGSYVAKDNSREVVDKYLIKTEQDKLADERKLQYKPFLAKSIPLITLTSEESQELSSIQTDLQTYINEKKAKWISGQEDVNAQWEQYLKELDNLGLQRYLEIYNTALDRYNSN